MNNGRDVAGGEVNTGRDVAGGEVNTGRDVAGGEVKNGRDVAGGEVSGGMSCEGEVKMSISSLAKSHDLQSESSSSSVLMSLNSSEMYMGPVDCRGRVE